MYHVNARDLPGNDVSRTFEGGQHGPCTVSFFLVNNRPGEGPALHRHAYDETFIILEGRVLVRVGDESLEGGPGDVVIGLDPIQSRATADLYRNQLDAALVLLARLQAEQDGRDAVEGRRSSGGCSHPAMNVSPSSPSGRCAITACSNRVRASRS